MTRITFKLFAIIRYLGENTPEGDLAEDILYDKEFPNCTSFKKLRDYFVDKGACEGARNAFLDAYADYMEFLDNISGAEL